MNNVLAVAKNEFSILARSPVVLVFCVIVFVFALASAAGDSTLISSNNFSQGYNLVAGVGYFFWNLSILFAFLTMCIGILSVADERQNGSFRVLLTKPLYRRDVITGKFIGIGAFLLLTITFTLTLLVSLLMVVYVGQVSITDLVLRMVSFVILLFLNSCFTLGLVMCLGLLFSKSEAIIISIAFIAFEWLTNIGSLPGALGSLQLINPNYLYAYIICFTQEQLFDTSSSSFGSWFNSMLPYIVLMVAEAIIIVLVSCMLFNREEA